MTHRILVTGGFGYLGGRLAQFLASQKGYEILLGSRRQTQPPFWLPQAKVVQTLWNSSQRLEEICFGVDAIVHLAGMNAKDCAADPAAALEVNAGATARLVQAAIQQRVKRFVYLSTVHVYGSPLTGIINEETKPTPIHPYAFSHRAGEDVVFASHQSGKIEGIVIRLSNAYGAPADKDANCWKLVVNDLCCQVVNTSCMVLKSSVLQRRDFISITDACRAIIHLLELPTEKLRNSLFNVSGLWSPTILEMAQRVAERAKLITGKSLQIVHEPDLGNENPVLLEYGMKKLTDTGFSLSAGEIIDEEIDQLIRFCLTHMRN